MDDADDLTQETFVVALRRGTGDRNDFEVAEFLRRTARHLYLRASAQRARRSELLAAAAEEVWSGTNGPADPTGDAAVEALRDCVDGLADRSRELVRRFYRDGQSRAEIAGALGMREAGVKTALQRLRAALRECMQRTLA